MKKLKRAVLFVIILFSTLICLENKVSAESDLYLNSLEFYVQINRDASINITEYWNIDIEETNTLYDDELVGAKKVLYAAALTYLAAAFSAILNLLRILLLFSGRRGRD